MLTKSTESHLNLLSLGSVGTLMLKPRGSIIGDSSQTSLKISEISSIWSHPFRPIALKEDSLVEQSQVSGLH